MKKRFSKGLTLIELMVIVLVISTLVLIALPHLIGASVRADIARVRQDMQAVESALEWYYLDYKRYPESSGPDLLSRNYQGDRGLERLTEQKYLDFVPEDRFRDRKLNLDVAPVYAFGSSQRSRISGGTGAQVPAWVLISPGPDGETDSQDIQSFPFGTVVWQYDASNGLRSDGDIVQMGGDWQFGDWYLDGKRIKGAN